MNNTLKLPKAIRDSLRRANPSTSRRNFLKCSGALVLSYGVTAIPGGKLLAQTAGAIPYPDPDFLQLDTWIVTVGAAIGVAVFAAVGKIRHIGRRGRRRRAENVRQEPLAAEHG